jgi:hypothetical protein
MLILPMFAIALVVLLPTFYAAWEVMVFGPRAVLSICREEATSARTCLIIGGLGISPLLIAAAVYMAS